MSRVAKGGERSLETAAAQQVKGDVLRAIGGPRLPEAEAASAACLASRERALGPQHPDTAIALLGEPSLFSHTRDCEGTLSLNHSSKMAQSCMRPAAQGSLIGQRQSCRACTSRSMLFVCVQPSVYALGICSDQDYMQAWVR